MSNDEIRELVRTLRELGVTEYESIGIKLKLSSTVDGGPATILPEEPEHRTVAPPRASLIDAMVGKPRST